MCDVFIIIQARLSSTRLPGKILYSLDNTGNTSLDILCKRIQQPQNYNYKLAVATTTDKCDEAIQNKCKELNIECYTGEKDDVLSRYYHTSKKLGAKHIVRITSDCPFTDPREINRLLDQYFQGEYDYVTNSFEGSFLVDGFDVEIFTFNALEQAYLNASKQQEREHVTFYLRDPKNNFKCLYLDPQINHGEYKRLTLDTPSDLRAIKKTIRHLDNVYNASMDRIIEIAITNNCFHENKAISKNEGWKI